MENVMFSKMKLYGQRQTQKNRRSHVLDLQLCGLKSHSSSLSRLFPFFNFTSIQYALLVY